MKSPFPIVIIGLAAARSRAARRSLSGPNVLVARTGRSFDQFRADDLDCRQYAYQQIGGKSGKRPPTNLPSAAPLWDCNRSSGRGRTGRSPGRSSGCRFRIGGGIDDGCRGGYRSSYALQRSYDNAFVQCMYAKGHRVPVPAGMAPSHSGQAAVPPPPSGPSAAAFRKPSASSPGSPPRAAARDALSGAYRFPSSAASAPKGHERMPSSRATMAQEPFISAFLQGPQHHSGQSEEVHQPSNADPGCRWTPLDERFAPRVWSASRESADLSVVGPVDSQDDAFCARFRVLWRGYLHRNFRIRSRAPLYGPRRKRGSQHLLLIPCVWSGRRDSNSRPPAPHASALPGCATPRRAAHYTHIAAFKGSKCRSLREFAAQAGAQP